MGSFRAFLVIVGLAICCAPALASPPPQNPDLLLLDQAELTQMETKADRAAPREQCYLYTELVHNYTQLAGKQLADGETAKAGATLKRIQGFAARIHQGLTKDTKRVKNAEMLMHMASRNLGEYLHHASSDDKAAVEVTLKQLEKVNDELLAQVFAN